jgi:hypothetical protein
MKVDQHIGIFGIDRRTFTKFVAKPVDNSIFQFQRGKHRVVEQIRKHRALNGKRLVAAKQFFPFEIPAALIKIVG